MKIDFANLQLQYQTYKDKIDSNIQAVLNKSNYILGEEVQILEQELQKFTGVKYAITCSSGTDALLLALMAIDIQPGDEVITTPFTWISTGEMIALLKVIIDGAQSFGSTYNGKTDSNLGDISITSFFPSKPLGCYGDGGAVFTSY